MYKLINAEKNKGLLEDVPHKDFLDLSIVFQCLVSLEEIGEDASILINNTHSEMWNVSVEELYQAAMENTHQLCPYEIKDITDVSVISWWRRIQKNLVVMNSWLSSQKVFRCMCSATRAG